MLFILGGGQAYADEANLDKEVRIISKFFVRTEAEKLMRSLNKSGQNVRITTRTEEVTLKSISLGLFANEEKARVVVKHLKSHQIDAFSYRVSSGEYRVHAGAMQQENHYWHRFEKLLALGYKQINTILKKTTITHFFVVRPLIKRLPPSLPPKLIKRIPAKTTPTSFKNTFRYGRFKGEFNAWKDKGQQSSGNYFNAALGANTKYKNQWEMTYGSRFEATEQSSIKNVQTFELQWLPTYLSVRESDNEMHFGFIDGRWDDNSQESLSDRMSSKILTRYRLDEEVVDRRRPIIGARWQFNHSNYQVDVIANPVFRPAKLPVDESIWHPVSRTNGAMLGIRSTDNWRELIKKGSFAGEKYQFGGIGIRLTHRVGRRIRAITLQYARRSEPYYELNTSIQKLIALGSSVENALAATSGRTFRPKHPHTVVFSWAEFGKVSHFEVTASSSAPYTTTAYQMKTTLSLEWVLGFIYPTKNKNIHLSSFFTGRRLNTGEDTLDRKLKLGLQGEVSRQWFSQRWLVGVNYQVDLDQLGFYLKPNIRYEQNKFLKISLYYQLLGGGSGTDNGFHSGHSVLGLNWQANF